MPAQPQPDRHGDISGFLLERTARRMKQYVQQQLSAAGLDLTVDQWLILRELEQRNGQSQYELAQATAKDAPTMTRIIDLLCRKGLTRREADPEDRRRFRIELTPAGRELAERTLPIIREARRKAWAGLTEEQLDGLVAVLERVQENLK